MDYGGGALFVPARGRKCGVGDRRGRALRACGCRQGVTSWYSLVKLIRPVHDLFQVLWRVYWEAKRTNHMCS